MFERSKLTYIVETMGWSIYWDGYYITKNLPIKAKVDTNYKKYKNKIIHFGSRNLYLDESWKKVHESNILGFTYFHGSDEDKHFVSKLAEAAEKARFCVTSCSITKKHLIKYGVPENIINVIPLGVSLKKFKQVTDKEKIKLKRKLNIPLDKLIIGSFQKDGNGWGEGLEPKLIKGPDIFCDSVEKIAKELPIFVLLTGPARGYVKNRLKKAGIPFLHHFIDYKEIPKYYSLLDCYIISSRLEGGPKSILESWASGVPVVSTPVGMVPDISKHEEDVLIVGQEDVDGIYTQVCNLLNDNELKKRLIENGSKKVTRYSWKNIAKQYYDEIYAPIISCM